MASVQVVGTVREISGFRHFFGAPLPAWSSYQRWVPAGSLAFVSAVRHRRYDGLRYGLGCRFVVGSRCSLGVSALALASDMAHVPWGTVPALAEVMGAVGYLALRTPAGRMFSGSRGCYGVVQEEGRAAVVRVRISGTCPLFLCQGGGGLPCTSCFPVPVTLPGYPEATPWGGWCQGCSLRANAVVAMAFAITLGNPYCIMPVNQVV